MTTRGIYPFLGHGDLLDPECLHTSISAQGHRVRSRAISLQLSPPNWGRRLREQCGFLRHGREEKAVTKGLGTDTWTPIVPALCLSG